MKAKGVTLLGTEMITEGEITKGEVAVEVETGMIVTGTVAGTEIIVVEVGAAVQVLIMIEAVIEESWMKSLGGAGLGHQMGKLWF